MSLAPRAELPSRPKNVPVKRLTTTITAAAMLAAVFSPLSITPAHAGLSGVGPVDPNNGYPTWFSDGTVKLQFCYTAELGCLSTPPNAGAPASYPDNFPDEAFWFAAEASDGGNLELYEAALEGAHLNDAVVPGEQVGFARLRFRLVNLVAGEEYTITHPYGVDTFEAADEDGTGEINVTIDDGMCNPTTTQACDWEGVGAAFLGDYQLNTTTFLRQVNAPAGTLGNPAVAAPVTGAPSGNNFVRVDGPNAGGPGVNTLTVSQFNIQGVISDALDGAPGTPDLAAASDSGRSATDNTTNVATPTFMVNVPAGTEVGLFVGTSTTPAVTGTSTGNGYSLTLPTALADGRHDVRAGIANPAFPADPAASEFLTSTPVAITVDTVAPTATIAAPMPSNPTLDRTPSFNFSSNEDNSSYDCQLLPSSSAWETGCASGKTYDDQADAIYTFNVRAVDVAGNIGTPAAYGWGIGTVAGPAGTGVQKDMDGNGTPDYIGRTSDGKLWFYPGRSNGTLSPRVNIGNSGWNVMTSLLMPGDFNGDTRADLIASDNSGRLWLYAGAGNGRLSGRTLIGSSGWNSMSELVAPGDFNGDTNPDLLARDRAGKLWLYPSDGDGGFNTKTVAGSSGWNSMTDLAGVGTFDAGSTMDMIARDGNGRLWLYPGNGSGQFGARSMIGSSGWNSMTSLVGPGAFDTGANNDVIARHRDGRLWLYPGNGSGLSPRIQIGHGFNIFTMIAQ